MSSLRSQLTVGILSGMILLVGAGGVAAYIVIQRRLYSEFDRGLLQRAVLLASMIEEDAGAIKIEWLENGQTLPAPLPDGDYFSVWTQEQGDPLAASPGLDRESLPRFGGSFAQPELRQVILPGGLAGRGAGIQFDVRRGLRNDRPADARLREEAREEAASAADARIVTLVIAKADTVASSLAAIRRALVGVWAGCTILSGLIIWLVVRRALQPLAQLQARLGSLQEATPGQRVVLARQPAELEPVTHELNRLLERVEQAFLRERTLTSNVAHELRTPIAGLLCTLEVTLNRLRSPGEYRESAEECFEMVKRMNWLVNNLLSISRMEAGNVRLHRQEVPIGAAFVEWWKPFESRCAERNLRVDWSIASGAVIQTDPEFLRVVMTNLFDNAVAYTPEGGRIRIEGDCRGGISVANQADALNDQVIQHVFDPFWRRSESRDGEVAHAGLGLSLCKKIIESLGGRISAEIKPPEGWFMVRVEGLSGIH